MTLRNLVPFLLLLSAFSPTGFCQETIAIRNARIVPGVGETMDRATVLIENGRIGQVGSNVRVPSRARVIDGRGLTVYPGLFNPDTQIGLTEIGSVNVTDDSREMGEYMPHLLAFAAVHVESEHIPVARVDGVTHALTAPSGGTLPGQAALIHLDGWSPEEMEISRHAALVIDFPSLLPIRSGFGGRSRQRSHSEVQKEFEEKLREVSDLFARARHYGQARQAGTAVDYERPLEALLPALKGEQVVLIRANSHVDIREAVKFAGKEGLNFVLVGARESWKVADFLAENNVRVILGPLQALPLREDDPIDIVYRTPAILHAKGVQFALSTGGASDVRTLPFEAGNAVAHGLPWEEALRAITVRPAEFLGVADQLGTIEEGKVANLVVTDGDILDYRTNIRHVLIKGKPVVLESKHTGLYRKYISRP